MLGTIFEGPYNQGIAGCWDLGFRASGIKDLSLQGFRGLGL